MKFGKFKFQKAVIYEHFEVDLSKLGVVFVQGKNLDTKGSNGAGKSLPWDIFDATLFAVSDRGIKKDDLVMDKNYMSSVEFVQQGIKHKIVQYRKHDKHKDSYKVTIDGTDRTPAGGIPTCEKYIKGLINYTEAEYFGFIHMGQHSLHTLIEGSGPDRLKYISSLFGLGIYDQVRGKVKDSLSEVKKKLANINVLVELCKNNKEKLEDLKPKSTAKKLKALKKDKKITDSEIKTVKKEVKQFESIIDTLEDLEGLKKGNIKSLKEEQKTLQDKASKIDKKLNQIQERDRKVKSVAKKTEEIKNLKNKLSDIENPSKELNELKANLSVLEVELENWTSIKGGQCPVCKNKIGKKLVKVQIKSIEDRISSIEEQLEALEEQQKKHKKQIKTKDSIKMLKNLIEEIHVPDEIKGTKEDLEKKVAKLEKKQEVVSDALVDAKQYDTLNEKLKEYGKLDSLEKYKKKYKNIKKKLDALNLERDDFLSDISALETTMNMIEEYEEEIASYEKKIEGADDLNSKSRIYTALMKAYSNKGLKLDKIKQIGINLTDRLNVYGKPLFSEKNVKFSIPSDENKLDFLIERGGKKHDIRFLSGGEKKRLNIAFILATHSMTPPNKSSNLIILDEVDANMDAIGQEAFRTYLLPRLKKDFESVIIISHADAVKSSDYDQIWTAIKKDGISKMKMQRL